MAAPGTVHGQGIIGKVVASSEGSALAQALVSAISADGTVVAQSLSDQAGNFRLTLEGTSDTYVVRAERIGFATGEVGGVAVGMDNDAYVRLELPVQAIDIGNLTVTASATTECSEGTGQALAVEQLWGEALKALRILSWAGDNADVGFEIRVTETDFLEDGRTVQDAREGMSRGSGTQPFRTADHQTLATRGFVLGEVGERQFLAPDAAYLLSPTFLETHCLRWQGLSEDGSLLGLAFKPRLSRSEPEIAGTIWIDGASGFLQQLGFEYVNVWFGTDEAVARGGLSFGQLESGEWLVSDWFVTTPRIAVRPRQLGFGGEDSVVVGFRERRGSILRAWTGDSQLYAAEPAPPTEPEPSVTNREDPVEVTTQEDPSGGPVVFGKVQDIISGAPIGDLELFLTRSGQMVVTDSLGEFSFVQVEEGPDTLRMRHLAYGEQREVIDVPGGGGLELDVRLEALPVELEGIEARGEASRQFESSIAGTRFDGLRPSQVEAILPRVTTAADLLRAANIPGLTVQDKMMPYGPLSMPTMGTCVTTNRMRSRGGDGSWRHGGGVHQRSAHR